MVFAGFWNVVSSPSFDDVELHKDGPSYIQLEQDGDTVTGEYQFGLQSGGIDGHVNADDSITFTFDGYDESTLR